MKKLILTLCMLWLVSHVVLAAPTPITATDGIVELPDKDGAYSCTVDGTVTFQLKSTTYSYKDCGVIFSPSKAGEIIIATVQSVDLPDKAALLVYDSNIAAIEEKFAKSGASSGTYRYFPDGWTKAFETPTSEPETFQSTDAEGKMAFGLHTTSWTSGKTFVVTVTSATPKDMEYVSSSLSGGSSLHRGQTAAPLAYLNIVTDGINQPLDMSAISVSVAEMAAAGINDIALYSGRKADGDNLLASNLNGVLSWEGSQSLSSGSNYFTICADIPADFVGELPFPTDAIATVSGIQHSFTTEGEPINVENVIYMASIPVTYTISDRTNFYDDGGINGKISENFNGTVTFVPASEGNKIRIDFDKLAIFYNSSAVSVGNQDVFKFYNGRTADDDNLIATLTDKAKIIKSTAEDGSLTVTLASKTGVPADGWEAVVNQFIPGDMTVDAVEAIFPGTSTASAYDTDINLASINVRAVNTLNPLSPQNIVLNISGAADIEKITVYALGEENVFSTSKSVGEAIPSVNGNLMIELTDAELSEGSNYYAIVAAVRSSASNGDVIKVKPISVNIAGTARNIEGEETTELTIANRYSHRPGTDLREIHDVWEFVSTPDVVYPSKYKLENAECQVTFVPNEGASAILDFSEFDVYYSSSSYGAKATFEVYSGRTADAANLLWKLDTNGGKPDGKLKSAAEDGSITIVFNANTSSSYYAGSGWTATVTPFINHDMTINSINVSQSNTSTVMPGGISENFLNIDIATEGNLDQRKLTSVTVDLKGNASGITRVSLKSGDTEIGSAAVEADSEQVEIGCDLALSEGNNTVVVAFDIAADVVPDAEIDGKVVKISTDKGEMAIENGDPEGSRTAKYQYLMSDGNHVVSVSRSIHFYDDGGSDGILSKDGLNGTVTFVPADPTKKIRATVLSYYTAATGILDFYSGREAAGISLGQCKQRTYPELPMVSKADDGAMFVNVACKSYSYSDYDGWDILIEQYEPSDLYTASATADNMADATTVRGAVDTPISKVAVNVEGDAATVGVKTITATASVTNLSDIVELKLWYTAKADGYAPTCLLATATPDADGNVTFNIAEPRCAEELGTYYYWITATLSEVAEPGNSISLSINTVTDTKDADIAVQNVSAQTTEIKAGFAGGEFVIGASEAADYPTFVSAIAALGDAIEGPVTFYVEPGTYAEDITIDGVKGTSEINRIVFTSQSGNTDDVVLTGKGYVDGGYNSKKYGVFNVKNTDWVTLDHMTINGKTSGSTMYPYYVNYVEASRYNTLSNCSLIAETSTGYSGIYEVYVTCSDPVENGRNADFLTITGNTFTGGYIAVNVQGSYGYVKYEHLKGLTVANNTFIDNGSKGVYPYQVEDVVISGNTFTASTAVTKTSYMAIDMVRCKGVIDVAGNRIVNSQEVYSTGIYLRDNTQGTPGRHARVYNNSIAITNGATTSGVGINITTECNNIDVDHNTVNIEGTAGLGISISNTKEDMKALSLRNNLVRVNVTGTTSHAFNLNRTETLPAITFSNNAFFSTAQLSNIAPDLDGWKDATADTTLIFEEAQFIAPSDLHLATEGSFINGLKIDYISNDLDGYARANTPTIGAYEFAKLSEDAPEMAEDYPFIDQITYNSARLIANWSVGGKMHYVVADTTAVNPTEDEILAAPAVDAMADSEVIVKLGNLESETTYRAYMILEGSNNKNSEIVVAEFTTARYIAPLTVYLDEEQPEYDRDTEVVIVPEIDGGDEPYTVKWFDQGGNIIGEESQLTFTPEASGVYTVEVSSADGQKASAFTALTVYGFKENATFDDLKLEDESYWYGTQDEDVPMFKFYSGAFSFSNYCIPEYNAWGGFAYANTTATDFVSLFPGQFHNVVGGGHDSENYAVVFTMGSRCTIGVLKSRDGAEIDHVYVTNSSYSVNNMMYGDSFSDAFAEGDYHKVIFTGDDPQGVPVEFYLADYRDGKREIINTWEQVDLKPLGKNVKTISVTTESSNTGVPAYVVLDDLEYAEDDTNGVTNVSMLEGVDESDITTIRIITINGSVIRCIDDARRIATASDLEGLVPGIYFIEYITTSGRTLVEKQALR